MAPPTAPRTRPTAKVVLLGAAMALAVAVPARAEDFAVTNRVYAGTATGTPLAESRTVFLAGKVYDLLDRPEAEVVVFDPAQDRVVLYSPERRQRAELSMRAVFDYARQLQAEAALHQDPLANFLARPEFEVRDVAPPGTIDLNSRWLSYRVATLAPQQPDAVDRYFLYADSQAALNAYLNRGGMPPFGRMKLHEELRRRTLLPSQVTRQLHPRELGGPPVVHRATHEFAWTLDEATRARVAAVETELARVEIVAADAFRPSAR